MLQHKVDLFTHATTLQASYHGVPIVGMPLVGEQPDNVARAKDRGYGLSVSVKKLSTLAKDVEEAIKKVLRDPSFGTNAASVSSIMQAHRLTPAETAAGKHTLLTDSRPWHNHLYCMLLRIDAHAYLIPYNAVKVLSLKVLFCGRIST